MSTETPNQQTTLSKASEDTTELTTPIGGASSKSNNKARKGQSEEEFLEQKALWESTGPSIQNREVCVFCCCISFEKPNY